MEGKMQGTMQGKICLITGATNGIGKETARALARQGATVVLAGRNQSKGEEVVREIKEASGNQNVELLTADLSLMSGVRQLAQAFKARYKQLHVLVNNAGAINMSRVVTAEGYELTFALNHLNYFLLTNLLLDTIKASAPARIISVSSGAHIPFKFDFDDLQNTKRYRGFRAYGQSKLANIVFTYELARRLEGTDVTANAMHPGGVNTGFGKNNKGLMTFAFNIFGRFSLTAEQGAETIVYLATSPDVEGVSGEYFHKKRAIPSNGASYDKDTWTRLWEISKQLTGL